jgi:hypothetical protein
MARGCAASPGITERSAYGIVTDLTGAGYVIKQKEAAATATRSRRGAHRRSVEQGRSHLGKCLHPRPSRVSSHWGRVPHVRLAERVARGAAVQFLVGGAGQRGAGCSSKKRMNSALAFGPWGSV